MNRRTFCTGLVVVLIVFFTAAICSAQGGWGGGQDLVSRSDWRGSPQNDCPPGECPPGGCSTAQQPVASLGPPEQVQRPVAVQGASASAAAYPAVCRVNWPGASGNDTGVLVAVEGDTGIVLTAMHVARLIGDKGVVHFDGAQNIPVRQVFWDRDGWDVAALKIDRPVGIEPIAIASEHPPQGSSVTVAGYGMSSFLARSARVKGYARPWNRPELSSQEVVVMDQGRVGDSGCPMLDSSGRVVAILGSSNFRDQSAGPNCHVIRRFLKRVFARIRGGFKRRPKAGTGSIPAPIVSGLPPLVPPVPAAEDNGPPAPVEFYVPGVEVEPGLYSELVTVVQDNTDALASSTRRIAVLTERVDAWEMTGVRGEQGPQGEPGLSGNGERGLQGIQGEQGTQGTAGTSPDIDLIVAEVLKRLPPQVASFSITPRNQPQ